MAINVNPLSWFNQHNQVEQQTQESKDEALDKAIHRASIIDRVGDTRSRKTDKLAVSTIDDHLWNKSGSSNERGVFSAWNDDNFRTYLQLTIHDNKSSRIAEYRNLAKLEKLEACIHEISITCLASHDDQPPIVGKLEGDYSDTIKDIVNKEIKKVLNFFKFDQRGQDIFKEFLITGELAFENVFSVQKPEKGILDVKAIPTENIDPLFRNFHNQEIEAFILKKPSSEDVNSFHKGVDRTRSTDTALTFDTVPLARSQVTYCNSGEWDDSNRYVVAYITKGQEAQKKLALIEDSIVINALVNAPERLLWNIPTGNMDGNTKHAYMNNIANQHKKTKGLDGSGQIVDKYNPMSITEDLYIPVSADGKSATVQRVAGSTAFGSGFNGMLTYFHQKVYEDMHVPIARLNPDSSQSDGSTITMQELAFAERVIAIQKRVSYAIKETVITHLKLKGIKLHTESCNEQIILENANNSNPLSSDKITPKQRLEKHFKLIEEGYYNNNSDKLLLHELGQSYWDQYELKETDIKIVFSLPTSFLALREQQAFELNWNNFSNMATSGYFSPYLLAKEHLGMTDAQIIQHLSWRRVEAKKNWEIEQILANGPEFRELAAAEAGVDMGGGMPDMGGGGGGSALPDMGGGDLPPDFGGEGEALDDLGETPLPDEGGETPPVETPEEPAEPTEDA